MSASATFDLSYYQQQRTAGVPASEWIAASIERAKSSTALNALITEFSLRVFYCNNITLMGKLLWSPKTSTFNSRHVRSALSAKIISMIKSMRVKFLTTMCVV